jgi:hypothetical protein
MRRIISLIAMAVLAFACQANSSEPIKSLGVHCGLFSPADWRIQNNYYPGYNHRYIGVGNGQEIGGTIALIYDNWRFRLESGYRWQRNAYYEKDFWVNRLMDESKLNIVPIKFSLSRRIITGLWNSTLYFGAGTGLNFAEFKYKHATIIAEEWTSYVTEKYNAIASEFFILTGFDIPLSRGLFLQTEIRYSYCSSDWDLYYDGFTTKKVENVNIGGTTLQLGLERRF